ncbi:hypothetical protein [Streptomyces albipurpureus]|uniref:LPXTG cell wall anchor domain-containing protein n=1 Tax=Streptomyces albipurpureus TaxID=2897419 RepID=A0ABT0UUJ6_9ACTN|nr:hypothetical protein [Streptomyces sp. CWNU-1]MCM2392253.1 hypothetical protein [Streptomyces sp. CWNU-1]
MSSHRLSLRALAVTVVAAGALLVPATAAVADSSPGVKSPAPAPTRTVDLADGDTKRDGATVERPGTRDGKPSAVTPEVRTVPKGGVAAGEQPASSDSAVSTPLLAASAVVLFAGAGALVIRRRNTAGAQD